MSKLTDSQLIVLSAAAMREDGCAVAPAKMNKAAAMKVGASLVARKLMRETKAKPGAPVWRMEGDRSISLVLTAAGRNAIGVEERTPVAAPNAKSKNASRDKKAERASATKAGRDQQAVTTPTSSRPSPRAGSKQALLIEMLRAKTGATLDALLEATGWLPHTTRAALTGLRKRGYAIERTREGEASVYRIVETTSAAA